jgi:hypothetical protein
MFILDIEEIKKTSAKQQNGHITREFENDTFSSNYSNTCKFTSDAEIESR